MEAEMVRPIVKITNKALATLIITNMICSEQTKHAKSADISSLSAGELFAYGCMKQEVKRFSI